MKDCCEYQNESKYVLKYILHNSVQYIFVGYCEWILFEIRGNMYLER